MSLTFSIYGHKFVETTRAGVSVRYQTKTDAGLGIV
jgi:hypothetical protein